MKESKNYPIVKDFLFFNNIDFSSGIAIEEFYITYFVGSELRYRGINKVKFAVQHPEFTNDVEILTLDTDIYHASFNARFQEYSFDEINNIFSIINKTTNNKFKSSYKVEITKKGN